ncbi:dihydrolipoamide acetyltransferase family protein [Sphaerochaeta sp. PS]|uniref:dihydrolipoamide acetyltransferase family protein n=1 Tax=Sphaerochaeta sp. PS TaxID=3076336 RepID=UPI0028A2EB0F|nr:dihydrolipoamide acetyltransferase family protein [Sphaerochaeta sp. PS]MDT4761281.1 dihydrolipoamide acetyltransferase family protein [Sphaerochaeta sp. PS]
MAQQVVMPKQGNSVESCIIVEWNVKVGDKVAIGDVLCSAETDKSTIDVESTAEGSVLALLYKEGDEVPVMVPIAVVGEPGEKVEVASAAPAEQEKEVGNLEEMVVAPLSVTPSQESTGSSPRARALASSLGIPLSSLYATGPKGRVIERDVLNAASQPLTPAAREAALKQGLAAPVAGSGIGGRVLASDLVSPVVAPAAPSLPSSPTAEGPVTEIPVKGVRKVTARRMMASIHGTCQLTLHAFADARALKSLRAGFKASKSELGLTDVTLNDLVLFAVSRTLVDFPAFNAHFLGDKMLRFSSVHLGMATDTERGLLVPVIRNSQNMSLKAISLEVKRLVAKCKEGSATPEELSGSTFTVSNVGSFGIEAFTPVLNVPEVAILGVGTIVLKPNEAKDGTVSFIPHIGLSLTMDHQAVDGADAARFLKALMDNIASIDLLLAL